MLLFVMALLGLMACGGTVSPAAAPTPRFAQVTAVAQAPTPTEAALAPQTTAMSAATAPTTASPATAQSTATASPPAGAASTAPSTAATAISQPAPSATAAETTPEASATRATQAATDTTAPTLIPPAATVGPDRKLQAATFLDAAHGWAADASSAILVTSDGGTTWGQVGQLHAPVQALEFVSPDQGWASTDGGLFATSDGGRNWQPVAVAGATTLKAGPVDFVDAQHGWLAFNAPPALNVTTDGGKSWRRLTSPCAPSLGDRFPGSFDFVDPQHGFIICGSQPGAGNQEKTLFATADGGQTWQKLTATSIGAPAQPGQLPSSGYVADLYFRDSAHGWLSEMRGGVYATADGGHTWQERFQSGEAGADLLNFTGLSFVSLTQGFAVNQSRGQLYATHDGGATWAQLYPPAASPAATATSAAASASAGPAVDAQRDTPEHLLQSYYAAVNAKDFKRAYSYWEKGGTSATSVPPDYPDFVKGYATTQNVTLMLGTAKEEGAAGSVYANVPVILLATHTDGTAQTFYGCYIARRSNIAINPAGRLWRLYNAKIMVAPPSSSPAALLQRPCQP